MIMGRNFSGRILGATFAALMASVAVGGYMAAPAMAQTASETGKTYEIIIEENVMIPMRDGTMLAADIYRPKSDGKFPVLVERTPYNKTSLAKDGAYFAEHGYVFVEQDVRGRFASQGDFYPYVDDGWLENRDGYDTVEWIAKQSWSNGKVGPNGGSYTGQTAMFAAATRHPAITSAFARETASNIRDNMVYRGGALEYGLFAFWTAGYVGPDIVKHVFDGDQETVELTKLKAQADAQAENYWDLPLSGFPAIKSIPAFGFYFDWLKNPNDGPYWWQQAIELKHSRIEVPMYHQGGWYDCFLDGTLQNYIGLVKNAGTERARNNQRLIVGPWVHGGAGVGATDVGEMKFANANIFPDGEALNYNTVRRRWFDADMKGAGVESIDTPPVLIYVMGDNTWRYENEWPLARTEYTKFYFRDGETGSVNSLKDGTLSTAAPEGAESADSYVYDPNDPVTTVGGATLFLPSGPRDVQKSDSRSLTYTTDALEKDTEVTGPIEAMLYGMSSAVDTDWVVTLSEVYPDGRSMLIQDGILRARFRGSQTDPELLEPGKVYEFGVNLWATSNVFKAGNRIRVSVTSSNFPRWDRNLNSAESPEMSARTVVATNTIFHDDIRPSHIVLPIIPR